MGARLQKAVVEAAPGESRLAVTADRQGRCQVALCMGLLCAVRCTLYAVRCALCAVRCALCAVRCALCLQYERAPHAKQLGHRRSAAKGKHAAVEDG